MKKSLRRLAFGALAAAAAMQFTACRNRPETVYGPPEYFTKTDPANNEPVDVYGPPSMLNPGQTDEPEVGEPQTEETEIEETEIEKTESAEAAGTAEAETDFDPAENEPEDVYGPPSMMNPGQEEAPETVAAETEQQPEELILEEVEFSPELNAPVCVYGPPEYFMQRTELEDPEKAGLGAKISTAASEETEETK